MEHLSADDLDYRLISLGATVSKGGCYFSVWAPNAKQMIVHIYDKNEKEIQRAFLQERRGCIWYGFVKGVTFGALYAFEGVGDYDPNNGLFFKEGHIVSDPYTKCLSKPYVYDPDKYENDFVNFMPKSVIVSQEFDWQGIEKPHYGRDSLVIYETNVKGLTKLNEKVPEKLRGTYLGVCHESVIAHFKELGITAVQLNPIAACMSEPHLFKNGLVNYWGYNPVNFMAPDPRFACDPFNAVNEFKTMVRELHRNGISVILDVVYNHTAEGGIDGPVLSLKGLDGQHYYTCELDESGRPNYSKYHDVTGCGNSVNAQSRPALNLILDSLNYWAKYMQVDGFRFDLAVTVCRESHKGIFHEYDVDGAFLKACFCIDRLAESIMIAEPWDCGPNGYRVGQFPPGWSEQNDKFRDTVRRFWKGERGIIGEFATRIMGSRDVFPNKHRSINASINFVTYHDGFTLEDLVSYENKHNELNCEDNRDGCDYNHSSNSGIEGHTNDRTVLAKRWQLKRNMMATLLFSQGIPHMLGGDEFSRTQNGNNNGYCQDNELTWHHWDYSQENQDFIKFIGRITKMRHASKMLRALTLTDDMFLFNGINYEAHWYKTDGTLMTPEVWEDPSTDAICITLGAVNSKENFEYLCLLVNQTESHKQFILPKIPDGLEWIEIFDTTSPTGAPNSLEQRGALTIDVYTPCIKAFTLQRSISAIATSLMDDFFATRHLNRSEKKH